MTHKQVWLKVNAQCDEGILSLVSALNEIKGLMTLDSCQDGAWGAYVFFTYGENWRELAELLQTLSSLLSGRKLPCGFSLVMEWLGSNDKPRAQLLMEPAHVVYVADGIQEVVATLNVRMTELVGDR